MTEVEFKQQYVANFLSSYMAGRYESDCANGHRDEPYDHQPIEDAAFCADCAWEQVLSLAPHLFKEKINDTK